MQDAEVIQFPCRVKKLWRLRNEDLRRRYWVVENIEWGIQRWCRHQENIAITYKSLRVWGKYTVCGECGRPCKWVSCCLVMTQHWCQISSEKLQTMESEFRRLCKRRKLRVNGNKSKVISFNRVQGQVSRDMTFRYLRVDMAENGTMKVEVS